MRTVQDDESEDEKINRDDRTTEEEESDDVSEESESDFEDDVGGVRFSIATAHYDFADTRFLGVPCQLFQGYAEIGEEGPADEFAKMLFRLDVMAYFVLCPTYFWYRWCVQ